MSARRKASAASASAADPIESPPRSPPLLKGDKNWVSLQAALGKKDDQLVELREQHDQLINRSRDALQNWEAAMQAKDHVIQQLQFALRAQLSALERQEKINEDVRQRLTHKEQADQIQDKDVIDSRDKSENSIQDLDLRTTIADLKSQLKLDDWKVSSKPPDDSLQERVQNLEAALQMKEKEFRQQDKCCKELKAALARKDELLRLAEAALQSVFSRQEASFEVFEYLKGKMEQDKAIMKKTLSELNDEIGDSKLVSLPRGSSKSPEKPRSRNKTRPTKPREKSSFRVDDILSRISKGRKQSHVDSQTASDDDSSRDESPYFWLRARNGKRTQDDLSPLISNISLLLHSAQCLCSDALYEIGKLEDNWRRTEARMRAEISRRAMDIPSPDEQQH